VAASATTTDRKRAILVGLRPRWLGVTSQREAPDRIDFLENYDVVSKPGR
jgi:hypothetical protein